jgi:ABC-type polysaccharide/polyol phosphate export permease
MKISDTSKSAGTARALQDLLGAASDLWHSRYLVYQLTLRDIRVRYKQAVMGFAWAILTPLLVVLAGVLVRITLQHSAGVPVVLSSITGIAVKGLAWSFVASATGFAVNVLTLNGGLIAKVYFPRETLPLSAVLASSFDALIAGTVVAVVLPLLGWRPDWALLWVPVLIGVLFVLTLALALLVSSANLFFRDVKYLVQLLISFGIFFTPVFYEPASLGARLASLQMLNPLAPIFEGLRLAIADGHDLFVRIVDPATGFVAWSPWYLAYSAAFALVALVGSTLFFHRSQYRFAELL